MRSTRFYRLILSVPPFHVTRKGKVQVTMTNGDETEVEDFMIEGKKVFIPTRKNQRGGSKKVIFNPLAESVLQGPPVTITKYRDVVESYVEYLALVMLTELDHDKDTVKAKAMQETYPSMTNKDHSYMTSMICKSGLKLVQIAIKKDNKAKEMWVEITSPLLEEIRLTLEDRSNSPRVGKAKSTFKAMEAMNKFIPRLLGFKGSEITSLKIDLDMRMKGPSTFGVLSATVMLYKRIFKHLLKLSPIVIKAAEIREHLETLGEIEEVYESGTINEIKEPKCKNASSRRKGKSAKIGGLKVGRRKSKRQKRRRRREPEQSSRRKRSLRDLDKFKDFTDEELEAAERLREFGLIGGGSRRRRRGGSWFDLTQKQPRRRRSRDPFGRRDDFDDVPWDIDDDEGRGTEDMDFSFANKFSSGF